MKPIFTFLVVLCLFRCTPERLSKEELEAFVTDESNGLRKSTTVGNIQVDATIRPTDLWIAQQIGQRVVPHKQIDSLRKKYDQYVYLVLGLSNQGKEALHQADGAQYGDLLQTLSFRMNEYATLTTSQSDTIPVGDFVLNRTYGLAKDTELLFVFNRNKTKDCDWIQFNLNEFGLGIGNLRFRFDRKKLENVPTMNFQVGGQ
ncbi:MAG TPA: hypothetical protein VIU12_30105 [Chryseolinea sp.]